MRFHINMMNHNKIGQRSLEDPIGIFAHQLRALNHQCEWHEDNQHLLAPEAGINILVEGFTPGAIEMIRQYHAQGARYLILATEEPTPDGFNHGRDPEMRMRQQWFPEAGKMSEGILHLVPGKHVTDWYSQWAPTAYVELGYAPTLVRVNRDEPKFDFGFYGSMSNRRHAILKRLARRCGKEKAVRVMGDFRTQDERDAAMREAKVIVQIRKFEEMGLVSSSRCNTALNLGRPVVAEPHQIELSKPWDEIVKFTRSIDEFYDVAMMTAAAWKGTWARQFEAFKGKLTPEVCVGEPLKRIQFFERWEEVRRTVKVAPNAPQVAA